MASLPSPADASATDAAPGVSAMAPIIGGLGVVAATKSSDGSDSWPSPMGFVARTVQEYVNEFERWAVLRRRVRSVITGGSGRVAATNGAESFEGPPVPMMLVAVTAHVYIDPLVSPVTVIVVVALSP